MLSQQSPLEPAPACSATDRSAVIDPRSSLTPLTVQPPLSSREHRDALDSPGSSISSSLQREYDSLLSYAVPHFGIQLEQPQLQQPQLQQPQQQQQSAPPPPIPPRAAIQQLPPDVDDNVDEAADAVDASQPAAESQQERDAAAAEVVADQAGGEEDADDGSVTPSQLSLEEETDFDPTKTQLIEGLGNTGTSLIESLGATAAAAAAAAAAAGGGGQSERSGFDFGIDAASLPPPLPPPPPVLLPQAQLVEQAFNRHAEFEQDLGSLLHTSDADYRLSQTLNRWCEDLSRRMMEANHRVKLDLRDRAERLVREEKARLLVDMRNLRDENERLRQSVAAHRSALAAKEAELEGARERLVGAHEKIRAARSFADWRIRLEASRRQAALDKLAKQHYRRALARRALAAWKARLEATWRQLVERGCQEKAMRVCEELGAECEDRVQRLQAELEAARSELRQERAERERAEASMREALMRGVSALNLEAMRVFGAGAGANAENDAAVNGSHVNGGNEAETQLAAEVEDEADDSKPMARSPRPSSRGRLPAQPPMQAAAASGRRHQQPQSQRKQQSPVRSHSDRRVQPPQQQRQRAPLLVQADLPGGANATQRQASSVRVERHARPATSVGAIGSGSGLPNFCSPSSTSPVMPQHQRAATAPIAGGFGRAAMATRFGATGGDQRIRFID